MNKTSQLIDIQRKAREANAAVVAVSKTQDISSIRQAYEQGFRMFGENYLNEALAKVSQLSALDKIQWHFIGRLQSNKILKTVGAFSLIHSLDQEKHAQRIDVAAKDLGLIQKCLVQVNVAQETSKGGVHPEGLGPFMSVLGKYHNLRCTGLMTFPPYHEDPEQNRLYFRRLKNLRDEMNDRQIYPHLLSELSMGVSNDYEIALQEGATLIRIGSDIFGPRQIRKTL